MPVLMIDVSIPATELLKYYKGVAQVVVIQALSGERVQLPASALRTFVTQNGIHGRFEVTFSDQGKLINIVQI